MYKHIFFQVLKIKPTLSEHILNSNYVHYKNRIIKKIVYVY
jgi:hypothetical protein